ncbi:phage tail tape measure protein, partial [Anaerotignum sp.]|uniref:phage tail tape measure protein n=1 Tax=Anaerotignum sp. TaxID=2039241 RepID=UPI002714B0C8
MAYSYDGYLRFNTEVDQSGFNNGVNSMKSAAAMGAKAIGIGLTAATGAITAMSVAAIRVGSDFESSMSKVAAISGATGDDLQALSDKAKEMGATTQFSATQSADALQYMAMAGWDAQQSISGLPGVMNLAAASGEDLASVSDIVTDAITAFGLKAEDSSHFADVLAAAASSANTDVSKMGYTFKYAAPLAGALGYSIEDTAVAIGLMANAGIKSETAGTALRTMFSNMTGDVQLTGKELGNYTLKMQEADGTMVPLSQTMGSLREAFAKMTEAEKLSNAEKLVGKEAMSGLLAIVNASEADYNKLTGAIQNADGAAEDMAKTVNDNLKGDLTILGSTAESVGIKVYEKFQLPMRNAAQEATSSLNKVLQSLNSGQLDKSVDKIADAAGDLLATTAELAADGLPKLINSFAYMVDHGKELTSVIVGATTAFASYKVAIKAAKLIKDLTTAATEALATAQIAETAATGLGTKAWVLFNAAIAANPIGLAAIALGALAATVVYFNSKQEETVSENQKVIDSTNEEIEAWEKAKEARLDNVQAQVSELETTQDMIDELENLTDAEGKVGDNKARVAYLVEKINEVLPDSIK